MSMPQNPEIVLLPELSVRVATGETCYPGEGGFSAAWAEVVTNDPGLVRRLEAAAEHGQVVLRCARLDVTGRITKRDKVGPETRFVFSVEGLTYRKTGDEHGA